MNHAIAENWVDSTVVQEFIETEGNYSDSTELYQGILNFLEEYLKTDKDFIRYKGADVEVHLYAPIENSKIFTGKLVGREKSEIIITEDIGKGKTKERRFGIKEVSLVKRAIIWN